MKKTLLCLLAIGILGCQPTATTESKIIHELSVNVPRDLFFTRVVPTKNDFIRASRGCDTLNSLDEVKPFLDAFALDIAREMYVSIIKRKVVRCFDAVLMNPGSFVDVYLNRLKYQTYLGNNRMIQYWEATFPDSTPVYIWFEYSLVEI